MAILELVYVAYIYLVIHLSSNCLGLSLNDSYYHCKSLYGNKSIRGLAMTPGYGWDNLRNIEKGMIAAMKYSLCRTTSDERFFVPDEVIAIPIQKTNIQQQGEIFSNWKDYTSITSRSINFRTDFSIKNPFLSISGSYSNDYEYVKTKQVTEDSITTRVSMSYIHYKLLENPDFELDGTFKNRLLDIAYHIGIKNVKMAEYLAELLVRDFGTHVVTSVSLGAILMKEDHVKRSFAEMKDHNGKSVSYGAGLSFKGLFNLQANITTAKEQSYLEAYSSNITSSQVRTFGGPYFKVNSNIDDWEKDLDNFLTTVDRQGYPLQLIINSKTLPELRLEQVTQLSRIIELIIERYYLYNVRLGCTKKNSPNFYFQANIDDNTCNSPSNSYTFAGLYQTCETKEWYDSSKDFCKDFKQENPLVGGYSCPIGYKSQLLFSTTVYHESHPICSTSCSKFLFFKYGCKENCYDYQPTSTISAYWCYTDDIVKSNTGLLFGGVYTSNVRNFVTQDKSCPPHFIPLKFGVNMRICVSHDYEMGYINSVSFGGLFSCQSKNPLANNGSSVFDQNCPDGHSQHLVDIENDCATEFCVKAKSFTNDYKLPQIILPPFTNPIDIVNKSKTKILAIYGNNYLMKNVLDAEWKFVSAKQISLIDEVKSSGSSSYNMQLIVELSVLVFYYCLIN